MLFLRAQLEVQSIFRTRPSMKMTHLASEAEHVPFPFIGLDVHRCAFLFALLVARRHETVVYPARQSPSPLTSSVNDASREAENQTDASLSNPLPLVDLLVSEVLGRVETAVERCKERSTNRSSQFPWAACPDLIHNPTSPPSLFPFHIALRIDCFTRIIPLPYPQP